MNFKEERRSIFQNQTHNSYQIRQSPDFGRQEQNQNQQQIFEYRRKLNNDNINIQKFTEYQNRSQRNIIQFQQNKENIQTNETQTNQSKTQLYKRMEVQPFKKSRSKIFTECSQEKLNKSNIRNNSISTRTNRVFTIQEGSKKTSRSSSRIFEKLETQTDKFQISQVDQQPNSYHQTFSTNSKPYLTQRNVLDSDKKSETFTEEVTQNSSFTSQNNQFRSFVKKQDPQLQDNKTGIQRLNENIAYLRKQLIMCFQNKVFQFIQESGENCNQAIFLVGQIINNNQNIHLLDSYLNELKQIFENQRPDKKTQIFQKSMIYCVLQKIQTISNNQKKKNAKVEKQDNQHEKYIFYQLALKMLYQNDQNQSILVSNMYEEAKKLNIGQFQFENFILQKLKQF